MAVLRKRTIPFCLPTISEREIEEVVRVLKSGWLTTGEVTKGFETRFAEYVGASYAVAVASCTAGLFLSLRVLGIKEGDEVLLPTLTFCATANVCVHLGAVPVLCDVDDNFTIAVDEIQKKITPRTRAIIPVHFAGFPCRMDEILDIAQRHNLLVVEDAAHACGTEYGGSKIGGRSFALVKSVPRTAVFSFYPTKNLTTGEGGMVTTEEKEIAERIRILTLHGISKDAFARYRMDGSWYYDLKEPGYKFNLTDIQSALGIRQLERIDEFIARRTYLANKYSAAFQNLSELETPPEVKGASYEGRHSWHLYVLRLKRNALLITRDEFIAELKRRNIGASVHFIPIHRFAYYKKTYGYKSGDFPNAEDLTDRIISLPLYPMMTEEDVDYVIYSVLEIVKRFRR